MTMILETGPDRGRAMPAFLARDKAQPEKTQSDNRTKAQATTPSPETTNPRNWRNAEEPWPIWAALMVFLNVFVIAGMFWGLSGIVTVMVPMALLMLVMLVLIVFG